MPNPRLVRVVGFSIAIASPTLPGSQVHGQVTRDNFRHRPDTRIRSPGEPLEATRIGTGPVPVVLITGHSHGVEYFASLVARAGDRYTFHVLVPPGMGGTPGYPWPHAAERLDGEEWTERFVADARAYVERSLGDARPVLVAGWDTGVGHAIRLATQLPGRWRSLVLVGPAPYYRWYRPAGAEAPDSFDLAQQRAGRIVSSMDFWRTVSDTTWHRNTFPAPAYTADAVLGAQLKNAERTRPFEIHLRYFAEYLHGDHLTGLRGIRIPVFVLATVPPGPAARARAEAAWQRGRNPCVRVIAMPSPRLMPWHDHPAEFDAALAAAVTDPTQSARSCVPEQRGSDSFRGASPQRMRDAWVAPPREWGPPGPFGAAPLERLQGRHLAGVQGTGGQGTGTAGRRDRLADGIPGFASLCSASVISVHFVHEWFPWNRMEASIENEILDLTGPRSLADRKSGVTHYARAYSPEGGRWSLTNGVVARAGAAELENDLRRAPFDFCRLVRGVAVGDPYFEVRFAPGDTNGATRYEMISLTGDREPPPPSVFELLLEGDVRPVA